MTTEMPGRIAAYPGDPGYAHAINGVISIPYCEVFLDHVLAKGAIIADRDCGLIVQYVRDRSGKIEIDYSQGKPKTEIVYGKVTFRLKACPDGTWPHKVDRSFEGRAV